MVVRTPLMKTDQGCAVGVEDLTEVVMGGICLRVAKERLVPFEAQWHIPYADDRPCAFHRWFIATRLRLPNLTAAFSLRLRERLRRVSYLKWQRRSKTHISSR